jgi:hypothetical protein
MLACFFAHRYFLDGIQCAPVENQDASKEGDSGCAMISIFNARNNSTRSALPSLRPELHARRPSDMADGLIIQGLEVCNLVEPFLSNIKVHKALIALVLASSRSPPAHPPT